MKLERLHEYITSTTVITIGLAVAVACGKSTANGEQRNLGILIALCTAITLGLALRSRTWILIAVTLQLGGLVPLIPLGFRLEDLAMLFVFTSYLAFVALKIVRTRTRIDSIDLLILANIILLISVYVRNPVGIHVLGTEKIGGRPYFNIFLTVLAYFVLRKAPATLKDTLRLPIYFALGGTIAALSGYIGNHFPGVGIRLGEFYTGFLPADLFDAAGAEPDAGVGRHMGLVDLGSMGLRVVTAYFAPITLILPFYPLRFLATGLFTVATLLSGFRSALMAALGYAVLATWFRKRYRDLVIFAALGVTALAFLSVANGTLFTLPLAVQRAFSFLPGKWDPVAVQDAEGSSNWRFEMWNMVLTEDKWIKNKWLGDGFGFTAQDLAVIYSSQGIIGGTAQEGALIAGAYHSGPLSTVRYVGIIGLVAYLSLTISLSVKAVRLIKRARGTPLFPAALFVGLPVVMQPIFFNFIVGGFDSNFPESIVAAGFLRLLQNTMDRMEAADQSPDASEAAPKSVRLGRKPDFRPQLAYRSSDVRPAMGSDTSTGL